MEMLKITSSAFLNNEKIPEKYTYDGENINPEIDIEGIPEETKSLVLIVEDPDAPTGNWVHWAVFNIKPSQRIFENSIPGEEAMNDFKETKYLGPCPPSGSHRYFFRVYALDIIIASGFLTKADLELEMRGHVLAKGEIVGKYR
jgi:Raf kinase inhibitor-like YbhB/YbcL family protein